MGRDIYWIGWVTNWELWKNDFIRLKRGEND